LSLHAVETMSSRELQQIALPLHIYRKVDLCHTKRC
jgi:hypothetical protein